MGRFWILGLVPLTLGCQFKGGPAVHPPVTAAEAPTASAAWTARPTSMRIYPTTRFVLRRGDAVLETRVELLDEMEDPVKGAGHFRFELVDVPNPMSQSLDLRLYAWDEIQLITLEDQKQYYDKITRGYQFPLSLDNLDVAERRTMIRAYFKPLVGPTLSAELQVETDW